MIPLWLQQTRQLVEDEPGVMTTCAELAHMSGSMRCALRRLFGNITGKLSAIVSADFAFARPKRCCAQLVRPW
jgi:hypothetical protein